jgi:hypothetical protein
MIRHALAAALLAIGMASFRSPSALPADLQSYCESLASRQTGGAPVRLLTTRIERTITLPGNGFLWGAQWNPAAKTLSFFEAAESRLTILDSLGNVRSTIGRGGSGPAEFRLSPVYVGSRQRFRFGDNGHVLALDDRYGHVFAAGRQTQEVTFGDAQGALATDASVARIGNGWIVSMANRRAAEGASRSIVRLYLVRDSGGPRQDARQFATVRNVLSKWPVTNGSQPDMPYDDAYRRTWDAAGRSLAVLSYRRFAMCAGDLDDSASWRAWSVDARPREVTSAERDRLLKARFGATSGPIPMMGGLVEEYFKDRWPKTAPFYYDVTSLNDSTFAAVRLDDDGGVTADLMSVHRGYQGSMKIPASRGVIGGYSSGLLLLNFGDAEVEFLTVTGR